MKEQLERIYEVALEKIDIADTIKLLEEARIKYLGKKGEITSLMKNMKGLSPEERPAVGKIINKVLEGIEQRIDQRMTVLKAIELEKQLASEDIDVTLPSKNRERGHLHPLTVMYNEIVDIFMGMGFSVVEGPEVDTVYNNFDALNAPIDHPSRSMTDTFYITDTLLLRTQTSPIQIRTMKENKPPIRVIAPGRCFRNDTPDATHSPMFHQVEGLVVDKNISLSDLKGQLDLMAKKLFGPQTKTKFRPHHFPFTEPSGEVDVSCFKCGGEGCKFCKHSGWIEILGCGMVHPNVLRECGIDPDVYSGFAFGLGLERVTMLKYEIDDLRILYENDIRMIKQF